MDNQTNQNQREISKRSEAVDFAGPEFLMADTKNRIIRCNDWRRELIAIESELDKYGEKLTNIDASLKQQIDRVTEGAGALTKDQQRILLRKGISTNQEAADAIKLLPRLKEWISGEIDDIRANIADLFYQMENKTEFMSKIEILKKEADYPVLQEEIADAVHIILDRENKKVNLDYIQSILHGKNGKSVPKAKETLLTSPPSQLMQELNSEPEVLRELDFNADNNLGDIMSTTNVNLQKDGQNGELEMPVVTDNAPVVSADPVLTEGAEDISDSGLEIQPGMEPKKPDMPVSPDAIFLNNNDQTMETGTAPVLDQTNVSGLRELMGQTSEGSIEASSQTEIPVAAQEQLPVLEKQVENVSGASSAGKVDVQASAISAREQSPTDIAPQAVTDTHQAHVDLSRANIADLTTDGLPQNPAEQESASGSE